MRMSRNRACKPLPINRLQAFNMANQASSTNDKDAPLKEDIRLLGRLLGNVLRDLQVLVESLQSHHGAVLKRASEIFGFHLATCRRKPACSTRNGPPKPARHPMQALS